MLKKDFEQTLEQIKKDFGKDWERRVIWAATGDSVLLNGEPTNLILVGIAPISLLELRQEWASMDAIKLPDNVPYLIFDIRDYSDYKERVFGWFGYINPLYEDIFERRGQKGFSDDDLIDSIILRACRLKEVTTLDEKEFRTKLTTMENAALDAIYSKFANEGAISVVKMIQETNISRPIWTALLAKMKEYNFAQVEARGVKGTYIKFLH